MSKRQCTVLIILSTLLLLSPGCMLVTTGASIISSVVDRYEKYKIEKRLEDLDAVSDDLSE